MKPQEPISSHFNFYHMPNEKRLLFVLAAIQFTNIVDFMIIMPLGPQLMRLFDISPAQFSLLVSAYTFSAGIVGFLAAFFIDRFDRRQALLTVYAGFILGTLACALAPGYGSMVAARIVTGIFGGMLGALVLSVVADAIPAERRATAMGLVTAAFSAASVFGVPFGLYIASLFSWHAPFLFLVIVGLFIWLGIYAWMPAMRGHIRVKVDVPSPLVLIKSVLGTKNLRFALGLMMVLMLGNFMVTPFISPYMVANVGFTEQELTYIYLFGGFITIFSSPWIGRISDRFGAKRVYTIFALLTTLPILLITHLGITPIYYVLIITSSFFVVSGGRMIPAQTMVAGAVDAGKRGAFMSFTSSVQQLSTALAAFISGLIVEKTADGSLTNFHWVGYLSASICLLSILLARRIKTVS